MSWHPHGTEHQTPEASPELPHLPSGSASQPRGSFCLLWTVLLGGGKMLTQRPEPCLGSAAPSLYFTWTRRSPRPPPHLGSWAGSPALYPACPGLGSYPLHWGRGFRLGQELTQELKDHDAVNILEQLPLLSTVRDEPARGIPVLGSLVNSVLNHIVWLKVTSANILQPQVLPSADDQELTVKIPLDMVAGFNTPLVKTIVEMHMETQAQATIRMKTSRTGQSLTLSSCSNSHGSLRISLLQKLSFMVNPLANKVMSLLVPALPKLVKSQLCPVIEQAFEDMHTDLLRLVREPVSLGYDHLEFDLLSSAIKGNAIQLSLGVSVTGT
ncbi:BPI fold-containing family B member 1-like [Saccopteryx leptura]|uniref:BPI fold-containing family B member 1-like n=1 Tax=Saccopteryx leptura TaxID=249018 RepID=UPI00339CD7E5